MRTNKDEAFSRVLIDAKLSVQEWNVADPNAVRFEVVMPDSTRADYVLCDRNGRSLAVIKAKRYSVNPADAWRLSRFQLVGQRHYRGTAGPISGARRPAPCA